jgi:O-antigen/teichoic acid export membrane protein
MRLGQTSIIHFFSNILSSLLGFLATIYIARLLGAGPLGVYQVVIGLVSWLSIAGKVGLSRAITKRISEGVDQGEYTAAGGIIIGGLFIFLSVLLLAFRGQVAEYVSYPATVYIVLILFVVLLNSYLDSLLVGAHLVHISGFLSTIKAGGRSIFQILLLIAGAGTAGLFIGHIVGLAVAILLGMYFVLRNIPRPRIPQKGHFWRLFNFAKFSWLGSLQSRMFSYTDILVLGFFVSSGLIGVYAAAWNIAHFLILFSGTLQSTLFPEMSAMSVRDNPQAVSRIVEQSLSFGGIFLIPGLFGGILLGERILRIYGPEFPKGESILAILIVANLFMGYQKQLLNTLNAIDRPDIAFRVNIVFVVANVALNSALIYLFGWIGAAIATTASVMVSLILAYQRVSELISFEVPVREISKQWLSALLMAVIVYVGLDIENTYRLLGHNIATVLLLVGIGASVYFLCLLGLSREFRETIERNLPFNLPSFS